MRVAEVPNGKRKNTPDTRIWNGLNRSQGAADGEVIDCVGLSTKMWPAMSAADGRTRIGEWENATDVYETDGHLVVIDDNKLYYDGTMMAEVGGTKKQFAEINRKLVIWPDKIYINLNTGELGSLEANVSGTVSLVTGGVLTVSASSGKGKKEYKQVYGTYQEVVDGYWQRFDYRNTYFRTYSNLSYSNGWIYDSAQTGDTSVGSTFIGSSPQTSWNEYETNWSMAGTKYGKVTKLTKTKKDVYGDWPYDDEIVNTYYDYVVEYEIYDAAGLDLSKQFAAGDIVEMGGGKLLYNNQEAVKLLDVGKNRMVVEAAFVEQAKYYDVTAALQPGTYRLVTGTSMGTPTGVVFLTERAIRAGEQLFVVVKAGDSGLTANSVVYAYDPKTKVLEKMTSSTGSSYTDLNAQNNTYTASTGNAMTIERKLPDMEYICERDNRLYGVSNSEEEKIFNTQTGQYETVTSRVLHASALGQLTRWNVFEGAATDSYAVAVAGEGDFTGIVSYSGSVIAFKENRMYKLTGDYPAEFYLRSYTVDGVKEGCHKSLAIINEVLYYLSPYGVMSYSGGVPSLISYNLDLLRFQDAVGGRDRTRYYISMHDAKNGYVLYSYDTVRGIWVIESKEQATGIERVGDYAYACIDGKIYKLGDEASTETKEWMALLPETDEGAFEKKRYQYMALIADVAGVLRVYARQNDHEEWQVLGTITEKGKKIHRLPMDTIRCERIQFKLEGEGKATIWAMERQFTVGSER